MMNIRLFSLSKRAPISAAKIAFLTLTLGLGISAPGEAATVRATTNGLDSGFNRISESADSFLGFPLVSGIFGSNDFFSVGFEGDPSENKFIEWVSYELNFDGQDPDAYFDPIELGLDSSPTVGQTQGIEASQISFSNVDRFLSGPPFGPSFLQISFAPGSFGIGDFFTFGVDTNGVGEDSIPLLAFLNPFFNDDVTIFNDGGDDFGLASVLFQVKLEENDNIFSTRFAQTGPLSSEATVVVPTPALLPGLIGMGVAALRKRKSEDEESQAS